MWLGPDEAEAVFSELEGLSLPLTHEVLEPSPWFDESHAIMPASRRPVSGWYVNVPMPRRRSSRSGSLLSWCPMTPISFTPPRRCCRRDGDRSAGAPSVRFGLWTDGAVTVDGSPSGSIAASRASLLKLGAVIRHHIATEAARVHIRARRRGRRRRLRNRDPRTHVHRQVDARRGARPPRSNRTSPTSTPCSVQTAWCSRSPSHCRSEAADAVRSVSSCSCRRHRSPTVRSAPV